MRSVTHIDYRTAAHTRDQGLQELFGPHASGLLLFTADDLSSCTEGIICNRPFPPDQPPGGPPHTGHSSIILPFYFNILYFHSFIIFLEISILLMY